MVAAMFAVGACLSARAADAQENWDKSCAKCHGADGTGQQMEAVMRVLLRTLTRVNVNTAAAAQLPLVLDISEATAQAVVTYRAEHGKFKSLADLKKVPGINAGKLDTRRDRVAF